jgi:spore germination protein YaaH
MALLRFLTCLMSAVKRYATSLEPRSACILTGKSQAYVYKDKDEVMVSYDDKRAAEAKGKFIKDVGIAGFAAWHTGGDYNNILVDGIRKNMGF